MLAVTTAAAVNENHHSQVKPSEAVTEPTSPRVLTILSFVLERLVARNDRLVVELTSSEPTRIGTKLYGFQGVRAPNISIPKYLERIYKYTDCSPSCFVVGYVYIDRLLHKYPHSLVVSFNVHRLLVTSLMVAAKMLDDVHFNNAFYAKVGGVSNAELNKLELEFLFLLDFEVNVRSSVFEIYCLYLEKEMIINNYNNINNNKIERGLMFNSSTNFVVNDDYATEISVEEDTHGGASPPQMID